MVVPIIVREVTDSSVQRIDREIPVRDIADRFERTDASALPVVDDSRLVGIVTRTDVLGTIATGTRPDKVTAADVMTSPVATITPSAPIAMAAEKLFENDVDQLPVVEEETPIGLVRTVDLAPYLPDHTMTRPEEGVETEESEWEYEYVDSDEQTAGVAVGDVVRFSKPVTERDLELFAEVSGDKNPLHLDEEFAERTQFGRRIVHGALASSVISAALSKLPGLVIYLSQTTSFSAPVEIGERVTARCEVIGDLGHDHYRLKAQVFDETDEEVISGEAVVLIKPLPEDFEGE